MSSVGVRSFGTVLREYRIAAGLTQEGLAERARMSRAAIAKLERGTRQRPYPATIALLAEALSLPSTDRLDLERAAGRLHAMVPQTAQDVRPRNTLPIHFSSFVGRDRDVASVCKMLATQRLVTLVGAGGVGKTRLAVHAAEHFADANATGHHHDGIWFADLSVISALDMLAPAIGSSVGMEQCRTLDMLVRYLHAQRFLLVVDNCEHILDEAAEVVTELLRRCPDGQILATSRQPLRVDGERVYHVATLNVPAVDAEAGLSAAEALKFSAIRLFADRAEAADSAFELKDSMVPAVMEICARLEGIALAIELAAARTTAFSTATLAQRLDEHFLFVTQGTHGSLSRHKTMRAVFDWSYHLLDERERQVFRWLSIFVGGFTLELATSLLEREIEEGVVVETLASLVDKSLVQRDSNGEPPRYKMLEPARQYAREKLREHGEQNAAARAHANALLAIARRFDSSLKLTPDTLWAAFVQSERDNFRAAFDWSLSADGDVDLARRLAGSRTATKCGFSSAEAREWISAALETCDASTPREVRAKLALTAARLAITFQHGDDALAMARDALTLQQPGDLPALAEGQYLVGLALHSVGRTNEAEAALREAMITARESGAEREYVFASANLAILRYSAGDVEEARKLITEALDRTRSAGANREGTNATINLGEIEFASGHVERALCLAKEAAHFTEAHANLIGLSTALSNVSAYLIALSRYEEARSHAYQVLRYSRMLGVTMLFGWTIQHLAAISVLGSDRYEEPTPFRRAANLLGFVNEFASRTGHWRAYTEQQEYDKTISSLRGVFEEGELVRLMDEGRGWSEDQALAEALQLSP